jgi:CheY-like chemotaxis protein
MNDANVLIVDDDEATRRLLVDLLRQRAQLNSVEVARDGVDALHHVLLHEYAVMVLDVMMPKMSGVDFLDSIFALTSDPSLKPPGPLPAVVVVTSTPAQILPTETLLRKYPTLVRAVYRKPLELESFAAAIERLATHGAA